MFWIAKEIDPRHHVAEPKQTDLDNQTHAWSFCGAGYRESADYTSGGQESRPGSNNQDKCRDSSAQSSTVTGRQQADKRPAATTEAHSSSSDSHLQDTSRQPEPYM